MFKYMLNIKNTIAKKIADLNTNISHTNSFILIIKILKMDHMQSKAII